MNAEDEKNRRIGRLREALEKAHRAGLILANPAFAEVFDALEADLLGRFLALDVEENEARWRIQSAMKVGRAIKRALTNQAVSAEGLEQELDHIEGRKARPIA